MTRPLDTTTAAALDLPVIPLATIVRLDIVGDPLYCWTGLGDLTFGASETGDPALDGFTYLGTGTAIDIGQVSEGAGGSDALELSLAGVSLSDPMLRQVIANRNRWQFKRALVWMMLLDATTGAIAGKPFRIKTGRIDKMPYDESNGIGIVKCRIEGQQSYSKEATGTRYSEQRDIVSTDTSQDYIYSLANMAAQFGVPSITTPTPGGGFKSRERNEMV